MRTSFEELPGVLERKKEEGYSYLVKITAVDYKDRLEVIYFLRNLDSAQEEDVRLDIGTKNPKLPSVMKIFLAADWYERELSEMFGIEISGRKAKRLLLEKWDGRDGPLRKSFEWGKPYQTGQEKAKKAT